MSAFNKIFFDFRRCIFLGRQLEGNEDTFTLEKLLNKSVTWNPEGFSLPKWTPPIVQYLTSIFWFFKSNKLSLPWYKIKKEKHFVYHGTLIEILYSVVTHRPLTFQWITKCYWVQVLNFRDILIKNKWTENSIKP